MTIFNVCLNVSDEIHESQHAGQKTRFRKRDKVMFYGRKMLRQVKNISAGANKKKKILSKFTKNILKIKKESPPTRLQVTSVALSGDSNRVNEFKILRE